jgi:hypothetical protein
VLEVPPELLALERLLRLLELAPATGGREEELGQSFIARSAMSGLPSISSSRARIARSMSSAPSRLSASASPFLAIRSVSRLRRQKSAPSAAAPSCFFCAIRWKRRPSSSHSAAFSGCFTSRQQPAALRSSSAMSPSPGPPRATRCASSSFRPETSISRAPIARSITSAAS